MSGSDLIDAGRYFSHSRAAFSDGQPPKLIERPRITEWKEREYGFPPEHWYPKMLNAKVENNSVWYAGHPDIGPSAAVVDCPYFGDDLTPSRYQPPTLIQAWEKEPSDKGTAILPGLRGASFMFAYRHTVTDPDLAARAAEGARRLVRRFLEDGGFTVREYRKKKFSPGYGVAETDPIWRAFPRAAINGEEQTSFPIHHVLEDYDPAVLARITSEEATCSE